MHQFILLAQAQQQGQGMTGTFILVAMMFAVFWFLVWRPQKQEQKRHDDFIMSLKKGDKVATASGILGTIAEVDGEVVTLEIARSTKIRVLRRTIQSSEADAIAGIGAAPKAADSKENADDDSATEESGDKDKKSKKEKKQSDEW